MNIHFRAAVAEIKASYRAGAMSYCAARMAICDAYVRFFRLPPWRRASAA